MLAPGTRIGPYEVTDQIGVGGMGEVYRATDANLGRQVALKLLPSEVATDGERLARFDREARILAALNHPNIATIHGVERSGGTTALVMELVEGPTLADRIVEGPIPIDEAIVIARQVAEALEAAHEQGIVHRDLKPANVKVRSDGTVKVLDFGLAKLASPPEGGHYADRGVRLQPDLSLSPTITSPAMTQAGVILGTAAYMSPEQARGKAVDRRADIWAFGCVLFEMLTGRRAFDSGDSVSDLVAAILKNDPEWSFLPSDVPQRIRTLLRRCLEKDPRKRLPHIGLVRFEIEDASTEPDADSTTGNSRPLWRRALPLAATAALAGAIVGAAIWALRPVVPVARVLRFAIPAAADSLNYSVRSVAISPDSARIAFIGNGRIFVRSLSDAEAKPVPGSEFGGGYGGVPVFSPDGQTLAFWTGIGNQTTLKRLPITGGTPVTLYAGTYPMGMTWDEHGLVFGQGPPNRILRLSPNGGAPEVLVTTASGEAAASPQLLPGGDVLLFTLLRDFSGSNSVQEQWDRAQIVVQRLGSGERKTIVNGGSDARYLSTGHLIYLVGNSVFAASFDVKRLELTGPAVPVIEGAARTTFGPAALGGTHLDIANDGTIVYVPGSNARSRASLALIDRNSGKIDRLNVPPGDFEHPRTSPDGKQLAVGSNTGRDANIWIYDLAGTTALRQLTLGGRNRHPVWSTDGTRVAFQSDREGDLGIFVQRADGTTPAERLTRPENGDAHVPASWSPDGKTLLFTVASGVSGQTKSAWTLSLQDRKTAPFSKVTTNTAFAIAPVFSPDGRWVAYTSTSVPDGGDLATYVEPFPATGAKYRVGTGIHPFWSHDGKELFIHVPDQLVSMRVFTAQSFTLGSQVTVAKPVRYRIRAPIVERENDIMPDGRFLGVIEESTTSKDEASAPLQIQVIVNWFDELRRLAPPK